MPNTTYLTSVRTFDSSGLEIFKGRPHMHNFAVLHHNRDTLVCMIKRTYFYNKLQFSDVERFRHSTTTS